jgi:hypothetical protein
VHLWLQNRQQPELRSGTGFWYNANHETSNVSCGLPLARGGWGPHRMMYFPNGIHKVIGSIEYPAIITVNADPKHAAVVKETKQSLRKP